MSRIDEKQKELKKEKIKYVEKLIMLSMLYFVLLVTIALVNINVKQFVICGWEMQNSGFSGIVTVFMVILCVCMVNVNYKYGFRLAAILLIFPLFTISKTIISSHTLSSLPGFMIIFEGYVIILLEHAQLGRLDKNEKVLYNNSITDSLTGLANRRGLRTYVERKIVQKQPFYLMFFDLDNFKAINDTLGHNYGDIVLCEVANRWSKLLKKNDLIAKSGGDEFNVVFFGDEAEAVLFMEKSIACLSEAIAIDDYKYYATVSIGASKFPKDGENPNTLIKYADTAMYYAKNHGKNTYCLFNDIMSQRIQNEALMETSIRDALAFNYFYLVFQPQFTVNEHALRGFEVLLRLKQPNGNMISPGEFIPVAEKSGLILEIDKWVLEHAMSTLAPVLREHDYSFSMSINISAKHFSDANFVGEIAELIKRYEIPARCLEIEITEYCFAESMRKTLHTLNALKDMGVRIALDDFGTGYASLSALVKFPVDLLKIDKSFIDNIDHDRCGADFVRSIVSIGHLIDCDVIAEGVENEEQLKALGDFDCEYIQGFFWGKPLELDKAKKVLQTNENEASTKKVSDGKIS